ncbi:pyridoxamine 5'-phosphate oxidase family protein [Streptomyces sp. NPDC059080]|uniref:pyridoxamine 5'-phosphate oxidase family protein n=1 Tax=Streptomyces sp. NPDC059080 TaxID=3346718 RepID=UPI0036D106FE
MKLKRRDGTFGAMRETPFDVEEFLRQPLVARVATGRLTLRPVWFLWEDEAFWIFSGQWSKMADRLGKDPAFELSIDTCDVHSGRTLQVIARGSGLVVPFDADLAHRKLVRYLGEDVSLWDDRFSLCERPGERKWLIRLDPDTLWVSDQSFHPSLETG